jgi:hypothetical protein
LLGFVAFGAAAQTIQPEPIGLPASEFPVPSAVLDQQIAAQDTAALRLHAWTLWSGLTADSHQSFEGQTLPIWETWLSEQEAFAGPQVAALPQRRLLRPFARPSQDRHRAMGPNRNIALQVAVNSDKSRLLAFVKLSPDAANFVAMTHETPPGSGQSISYTLTADLTRLNAFFDQHGTAVADRKIVDFPAPAIDLKIVFMTVKASGLTGIPLWAGPAQSSNPAQPTPDTWNQCVAVDPTNSRSGTAAVSCHGSSVQAEIVPLSKFYAIKIDAATATTISSLLNLTGAAALAAGDFQIVVAMHVTTKEIANWTWQTFWWQNGKNPPNNIPGSIDGMPDATKVKGPWRNYAMCIADSMVVPATDPNGKPVVCYNPFLETGQADGLNSNCMSCHARATYPGAPYPLTYLPNGFIDPSNPQVFSGQTKTDFVWAVQDGAH